MNLSLIKTVMPNDSVGVYLIDNVWHDLDLIHSCGRSGPQNTNQLLFWEVINDFRVGSVSLIVKPSENEVNLSSQGARLKPHIYM